MGVSSSYLSKTEVQAVLGITAFGLWRLGRKYENFPQPTEPPEQLSPPGGRKDPEEVWDGAQLYRWAARTPEFSHRGAVLLRPIPEDLTPGRWGGYQDTPRGPALDWHTALGTIRFVHSHKRKAASDVATALAQAGNPDGVRTVCALYGDVGITGPASVAAEVAHPWIEYEAEWGDVAALAGQARPPGGPPRPPPEPDRRPSAPPGTAVDPGSGRSRPSSRAAPGDPDRCVEGARGPRQAGPCPDRRAPRAG
ncbi:hypothetical protein [Streptomyces sp. W1SF4]|uniref:hypothetical protein n=1 Tax=Streptomyces sp. W1SF4 TaxID=2305220 RepID=UPI0019D04AA0|nr:hypothetical protein [Streptomyces sp. W1SF4]